MSRELGSCFSYDGFKSGWTYRTRPAVGGIVQRSGLHHQVEGVVEDDPRVCG